MRWIAQSEYHVHTHCSHLSLRQEYLRTEGVNHGLDLFAVIEKCDGRSWKLEEGDDGGTDDNSS